MTDNYILKNLWAEELIDIPSVLRFARLVEAEVRAECADRIVSLEGEIGRLEQEADEGDWRI